MRPGRVRSVMRGTTKLTPELTPELTPSFLFQVRGSVHYTIPKEATQTTSKYLETLSTPDRNEPAYYLDAIGEETEPAPEPVVFDTVESAVEAIPLLIKFKLVRQTARCFEHIMKSNPKWGNPNEIYRRSLFVGQLSDEQKREIKEVSWRNPSSNALLRATGERQGARLGGGPFC